MKQWLAIAAAVVVFSFPVMVSASEETIIPPEANWTAIPAPTGGIAASDKRVASTAQEQASDIARPETIRTGRGPMALTEQDAQYQMINRTLHDE